MAAAAIVMMLLPMVPRVDAAVRTASNTDEVLSILADLKSKFNGKYWNYYDRSQWDSKRDEVASKLRASVDNGSIYASNPSNADLGVTTSACSGSRFESGCRSNYFSEGWQCFGFAWFIEYALFQSTYQYAPSEWDVFSGSSLSNIELQPGDLVRVSNHSIVVGDVSGGKLNCVEAWGESGCKISWSPGFNWGEYTTPSSMLAAVKNNGGTVYRFKGLSGSGNHIKQTYNTYLTIEITADTAYVKSLPCSEKSDSNSTNVEGAVAVKGSTYTATEMVQNEWGKLWYKVTANNGKVGYIYGDDAVVKKHLNTDITISGVKAPTSLSSGGRFWIEGEIKAKYNTLCTVQAYIYPGVVSGYTSSVAYEDMSDDSPWAQSYSLKGSKVDDYLDFNLLDDGTYTYVINVVVPNYYTTDGKTLETYWLGKGDVVVQTFTVGSTSCSHTYNYAVATAPTTSAAGSLKGTCSKCSVTTTVSLPKLSTTDYNYSVATEATCDEEGTGRYTWKTTTYGTFAFDIELAKTAHEYSDVVIDPDCLNEGHTYYLCTVCWHSYTDNIRPALGHSYAYAATQAPTTSSTGTLTGTCSRCSITTTVTLPKLSTTDYNYSVATAANCTADGTGRYTWKTTTYGTFYFDTAIAKTGHSYAYAVTKAPTISAAGTLTGTCSKCSGTTTVTLPKLSTTDYSYAVTKEPTTSVTGTGRYTWKTTTYGSFYFDVTLDKLQEDTDPNAAKIVAESTTASAGDRITVTISLENNPGVSGLSVSLKYDATVFTLKEVNNGTLFSAFTSGKNYVWDASENVTTDGVLATFVFDVAAAAESGNYTIEVIPRSCVNIDLDTVEVLPVNATITIIDFVYGDANGDAKIDMKDVVLLRKYMANYDYDTETSTESVGLGADANGDGKIDMKDVVLLRKYMANYDYDTGSSSVVLGPQ